MRSSHLALALSVDLFRYWGRMMWEHVGVENQSPFTTEMGRFLGVRVHRVRQVTIAEGRFRYNWAGSRAVVVYLVAAFCLTSFSRLLHQSPSHCFFAAITYCYPSIQLACCLLLPVSLDMHFAASSFAAPSSPEVFCGAYCNQVQSLVHQLSYFYQRLLPI